jgi:hypothetical protein
MILLFLITPTIRELIVALPLSLSSPSLPASRLLPPRSGLKRSDFVRWPDADLCNPALMSAVCSDADTTIAPGAAAVERDDHGLGFGRRHCDHWFMRTLP